MELNSLACESERRVADFLTIQCARSDTGDMPSVGWPCLLTATQCSPISTTAQDDPCHLTPLTTSRASGMPSGWD